MPDLGILGLEIETYIVIFEISSLDFVLLQNFVRKRRTYLNLGRRIPYLSIFLLEFENDIVILEMGTVKFV